MPKIQIRKGNNRVINDYGDFIHQKKAQKALTEEIPNDNEDSSFSGLLAIPTGGGKTFIAVEWLLKNWIDQGGKVLWIAHRYELLNQAFRTFEKNACENLLSNGLPVQYRIISGQAGHDRAANIHRNDDILIASKDSLRSEAGKESLFDWIDDNSLQEEGLFLVIDEAHHATAKTYRMLIDALQEEIGNDLKILGLTATPFRTDQAALEEIFPDDIIYATHLRTLITRGILSEPVFEEVKTEWQAVKNLDLKNYDFDKIRRFDLPGGLKTQIAKDTARNKQIIQHYLENEEKYGQTLVFALNIYHAELLNDMFNESGIEADLVISGQKDNEARIKRFRKGKIKVLINVQIVTEGTDLPEVQTAFLTRPTISKILMTQMIGRALRGKKSGGTEQAYIVSFIDNWQDKIVWVTPEQVFNEELEGTEPEDAKKREKRMIRRISIEKMAEFARMMDRAIDTSTLEWLDFLERIPVGFYEFTLFEIRKEDNESIERSCEVLVYSHLEKQYARFADDLPDIFEQNRGHLDERKVHRLSGQVISKYFQYVRYQLAFREEDVEDILRYYFENQVEPRFVRFDEREKYDIDEIARKIHESDCRISEKTDVVNNLWEQDETLWKELFAHKKSCFLSEIDLALRKITHGKELLREAAESGNAEAQLRLGYMYLRGDCGMPSDSEEAKKWFEKAANQGHAQAQYELDHDGYSVTASQQIEDLGNGVTLEMMYIPGGTFTMENEAKRKANKTQHKVTLSPFFMGSYPVTQAQWEAVMGNNPSRFKGANRPVERVSWGDAVEFCEILSRKTGKAYRLPTEAEWEYACRAGTTTPFYFGETITPDWVNYNGNHPYGSASKTTDVGTFPPNRFGLYDMHGNVWEWCQDWHGDYPTGSVTDPTGPDTGSYRVKRGGDWSSTAGSCQSAYRDGDSPDDRDFRIGFRLALSPGQ